MELQKANYKIIKDINNININTKVKELILNADTNGIEIDLTINYKGYLTHINYFYDKYELLIMFINSVTNHQLLISGYLLINIEFIIKNALKGF